MLEGAVCPPLLELRAVDTHYGDLPVLKSVGYIVGQSEIVCLLGGNGAGKTTSMKAVLGLVRQTAGTVLLGGQCIDRWSTAARVRAGIAVVPEGRRLFGRMSVEENLAMGGHLRRKDAELARDLDRVYTMFPRLAERPLQAAGTLSGGEQQMAAIGRALMARPRLICMDEPSMGLSPLFVDQVFATIRQINAEGVAIFLVEQNATMALTVAHRAYVLQTGRVVLSGKAAELRADPAIRAAYLGDLPAL